MSWGSQTRDAGQASEGIIVAGAPVLTFVMTRKNLYLSSFST